MIHLCIDKETKIPINIENDNGIILIGVIKNLNAHFQMPIVGKTYNKEKDYNEAIKHIEEHITLVKEFTEKGQSLDFENQTRLHVEECSNRVYIKLDFNGYYITGFTNSTNNKRGYFDFIKAYNKYNFFQVQISCKENNKCLFYTINGNVTVNKR
ncbi:hypothetical protein YDYSG_61400 [Paenibacillus tyrfis]|uniref:hypothetical protein n=1 Tax=Paenibacillus tyrfis TaxID=1501230 RepID=UPI002493CA26|nr:hypothetical protein [Paenibacillus tyrfis]GLI10107.1 hypothetical protein YDYSG_61400 [Paenibacillus tyrfis]